MPILLYVALPLCWVFLGLALLLLPGRFAGFIDANVVSLSGGRRLGFPVTLVLRAIGVGFIAFSVRFVLHLIAVFR